MSFWWLMRMIQRPGLTFVSQRPGAVPAFQGLLCISFTKGLGEARGLILLQTCRKSQLAFSFHPSALLTSLGGAPLWVHLGLGPMSQPSEGQRAVSHAGSWEPPPFMHAPA